MIVTVRLFALARQAVGRDRIELQLPDGATVGNLRKRLGERHPALEPWIEQMMIAVDSEYAEDSHPIAPTSEVACIPPVSGGGRRS